MKARVIKEHNGIKEVFPLGFETTYTKVYSKEDKVSEGRYVNHYKATNTSPNGGGKYISTSYIEPQTTPKGTFLDVVFIGANGSEYSGDWFYKTTGRSFTEFIEKN